LGTQPDRRKNRRRCSFIWNFQKKKFSGEIASLEDEIKNDLITTWIFVLADLDRDINLGENIDSLKRGIFMRGTQLENMIGSPISHGCMRM